MANYKQIEALKGILDLEGKDFTEVAELIKGNDYQGLVREWSAMQNRDFLGAVNQSEKLSEQLLDNPAAVWAAHVLQKMDELIYDLAIIRDVAKEADGSLPSSESYEGQFKILLYSLDAIIKAMQDEFIEDGELNYMMILNRVSSATDKP